MSANPFVAYSKVSVGNIDPKKLARTLKGLDVRLTNADLSGNRVMLVHPQNAKLIKKAQKSGKGLTTQFTPFEALADLDYHERSGSGVEGGSLWSWVKNKAWPWLKTNWGVIKPVVSKIADVAVPAAAAALGAPVAGVPAREAIKSITGVGSKRLVKGSREAKEHMARLRQRRRQGGSFRMP